MNLYRHIGIPETDILGSPLEIGDRVTIFNEHFITYENCIIIEKDYVFDKDEECFENEKRMAVQVDKNMFFFGLGSHEILKCSEISPWVN